MAELVKFLLCFIYSYSMIKPLSSSWRWRQQGTM